MATIEVEQRIEALEVNQAGLATKADIDTAIETAIGKLQGEISGMFQFLSGQITQLNNRMTGLEERMASLEGRMAGVETRLAKIEGTVLATHQAIAQLPIGFQGT